MYKNILILFLISFALFSCKGKEEKTEKRGIDDQSLMEVNRFLVEKDKELIDAYIGRMDWEMKQDSKGFWYNIVEIGEGEPVSRGDILTIDYSESLLDGTLCNSTLDTKPRSFRLGYNEITRGMDEGIAKMEVGDSARFIFPPNLAYGLAGDGGRVPPRSVVVCQVKLHAREK